MKRTEGEPGIEVRDRELISNPFAEKGTHTKIKRREEIQYFCLRTTVLFTVAESVRRLGTGTCAAELSVDSEESPVAGEKASFLFPFVFLKHVSEPFICQV